MELDVAAAESALAAQVGGPLRLETDVSAFGVSEVVDENMAAATRTHALEWGKDVQDRTLIAFGGAAPLHTARLATKLGIRRIIVPKNAGVGSAIGFLIAPVAYEVVRSRYLLVSEFDGAVVRELMAEMKQEAEGVVREAAGSAELTSIHQAFMRYCGQGYEIAVDIPDQVLTGDGGQTLREAFEEAYEKLYGRIIPNLDVEVLSWTLTLTTPLRPVEPELAIEAVDALGQYETTRVFDSEAEAWVEASLHERSALKPGTQLRGPAIIYEDQTTTVVPTHFNVEVNSLGYLVLSREMDR